MSGLDPDGTPAEDVHATMRRYESLNDEPRFVIAVDLTGYHEAEVRAKHSQESVYIRAGQDDMGNSEVSEKFPLPPNARTRDTTAQFNNGILLVEMPIEG